jgi:putative ABC transport system permease protein
VVSEVALALVLLVGAGLLLKTYMRLRGIDPGFKPGNILSLAIHLATSKYPDPKVQSAFFEQVGERIQALAGVEAVGMTSCLPLGGNSITVTGISIEGRAADPDDSFNRRISFAVVNPDYFRAMKIPLLRGRFFRYSDRRGAPAVALVSESFARRYFPNEDPAGRRIKTPFQENEWLTLVGVVGDVRQSGPEGEVVPQIYQCYLQAGTPYMSLAVRTNGDAMKLADAVRSQIAAVDRDQPPHDIMPMERRLSESINYRRVNMLLLGTFAALALLLASMGIYGVIAFAVTQRTHEIGIRMALGATPWDVVRIVVSETMILCASGVLIGIAAAVAVTRFMGGLIFGISATDLPTFAIVPFVMVSVVLAAGYLPSRRAARVDPILALRHE